MCGRFAASASTEYVVEIFQVEEIVDEPAPSWNVAPTDPVAAIVERHDTTTDEVRRKLVTPRWGLVPSWSKDPRGGARMINARFETVDRLPAFRKAFTARRCLVPAEGYFEWYTYGETASGKPLKQPWFIAPRDGSLLAMAGLYEFWKDPATSEWLTTCTVITTEATDAVGHIHDRMPMTVDPNAWSAWLDPHLTDPAEAKALLGVLQGDALRAYPVAQAVGSVRNNAPTLLDEVPPLG